jgi:antitoxin CptB
VTVPMDRASWNRLKWNCRRGMLELDLVLERFMLRERANLTREELALFGELLETEDNDLWDIVNGRSERYDSRHRNLIERLRAA